MDDHSPRGGGRRGRKHVLVREYVRSVIVNAASVLEAQSWFQGDFVLILKEGSRVTTGRQYRDSVRKLLGSDSHT